MREYSKHVSTILKPPSYLKILRRPRRGLPSRRDGVRQGRRTERAHPQTFRAHYQYGFLIIAAKTRSLYADHADNTDCEAFRKKTEKIRPIREIRVQTILTSDFEKAMTLSII
jgi:hypothetical protein